MNDQLLHSASHLPEGNWYRATARQIHKDFITMGVEVHFPDEITTSPQHALTQFLLPVVKDLIRKDRQLLMQIIYRVDITERSLGGAIGGMNQDEASYEITRLIIEREKFKIELRNRMG